LSSDPQESFKLFQQRIVHEYEDMVDEFGLTVMDATLPIPEQQRHMREIIRPYLQGVRRIRSSAKEAAWATLARDMRPSRP
ncbi:MAG TPA: thymidylate kinase, partial [Ktedonobacteraceae bacterium]|nr:thymidylate kinase [Ktedonobacteraceae bacterium]